jgi:hypothetical protein
MERADSLTLDPQSGSKLARARDAQRHFFRLHGRAPTPDKLADDD